MLKNGYLLANIKFYMWAVVYHWSGIEREIVTMTR